MKQSTNESNNLYDNKSYFTFDDSDCAGIIHIQLKRGKVVFKGHTNKRLRFG